MFIDRTGLPYEQPRIQKPLIVSREEIEAEVERLASLPAPANGRRMSIICNPATGPGNGFAPGTGITLSVLKPGERTKPIRHNSSQVNFCIQGAGQTVIDYKDIRLLQGFTPERAKIFPRRISGTCAKHQRKVMQAIKRARILALLPFTSD